MATQRKLARILARTVVSITLTILAACGGGGGGGSSPTDPGSFANIDGGWIGTATSESASGTCLAENFQGVTVALRWQIQQAGGSFTGTQTLNNIISCPFRGTVRGNTVTFFPDSGGPDICLRNTLTCGSGSTRRTVRIEVRTETAAQTGTVTGDRISTSSAASWRVFDARTGESLGDYTVRGRQELRRP